MIFHDIPQNSPEWDVLRLGKATSSKAGVWMANEGKAFGEPAKQYALQLALERITGRKSDYSFKNEHMERGHEQEPEARMLYEETNFVDVTNGGFFDWGEFGDSPDGRVGEKGAYEGKAVIAHVHYANKRRGAPDPAYRWQLVSHIDCGALDWVDFASYCADFPEGQQLIVYRLTREECAEEIERLRARRDLFLQLVRSITEELKKEAA